MNNDFIKWFVAIIRFLSLIITPLLLTFFIATFIVYYFSLISFAYIILGAFVIIILLAALAG
ncbi:Uncharacterized protein EbC_22320 [Erwinia billingiae Eb661]|uniref:Uncharacterized protein n=1 Tax=Erwinia billingiae (strain Eb661) TaxID=634500 RepID=D8MSF6_ERWBE|nr:Uncharacterized protein EbC_22320 [Erwinia billingiae Eb661]